MLSLMSLLVAAALVSQLSGFEASAQIDHSKLTLDNNLHPHMALSHPKRPRPRRLKQYVHLNATNPSEIRRMAGERVELQCFAMGNPPPTITWEKNGHRLEDQYEDGVNDILPPVSFSVASLVSKLIITSTTPGEDTYTCVATAGLKSKAATTVVYTFPGEEDEVDLSALQKMYLLSPTITRHYVDLLQALGTTAVLPCRAESVATPVVFWEDPTERLIYDNPTMRVLPSGDLMIDSLEFHQHMGNFTCTAKNMFGKTSITTFVYPTAV